MSWKPNTLAFLEAFAPRARFNCCTIMLIRTAIARLIRPPSIYQLIYATFLALVVPFVIALGIALAKVGHLAAMSRLDVLEAQQTTIDVLNLAERLRELERVTLQYRVLRENESLLVYQAARAAFLKALRASSSPLPELRDDLAHLRHDEARVYELLPRDADADQELTLQLFSQLYRTTQRLIGKSQTLVTRYANHPPAAALSVQRTLIEQLAFVLPVAVILGAFLLRLIIRPIRHVENAIQQLGRGELETPIDISGPRDLAELGRRLDWLRKRLGELEAEKMSFLRNISHELKTPLTSIREGSDLLRQDYANTDPQDQQHIAQILYENSLRLQLLIDNLLHFNRTDRPPAHRVDPVRLDQLIERVLKEHRLAIASKQVLIEKALVETSVAGNLEQLRSVIDNLIANALKFSPRQGKLQVRLTHDAHTATLDICDSGPGISGQDRERVFELFYQGVPPPEAIIKGTGLGLAIAKDYVELHGGHIAALPAAVGAHLRVTLPLLEEAPE